MKFCRFIVLFVVLTAGFQIIGNSQPITGVWKGRVNNKRAEIKFIQNGDSITGTSYYPALVGGYRRYSIKGYFDGNTNSIVWWDDQLLHPAEKSNKNDRPLFSADYNCPGGTRMFLTSYSRKKDQVQVDLTKVQRTSFADEWDYVVDNYQDGANNKQIIDSIGQLAFAAPPVQPAIAAKKETRKDNPAPAKKLETRTAAEPGVPSSPPMVFLDPKELKREEATSIPPKTEKPAVAKASPAPSSPRKKQEPVKLVEPIVTKPAPPLPLPITNHDRLVTRKKVFAQEIPVTGDSLELRFYDNAEVDGDSIALYLNDRLLFEHVLLTANAYTIKLPVSILNAQNELVMVAENLGTIPPNTAYMVVLNNGKRYEAQIVSTETTSAFIRLTKN